MFDTYMERFIIDRGHFLLFLHIVVSHRKYIYFNRIFMYGIDDSMF